MLFWFFWHLADLDKAGIKSRFWALLLAQTSAEILMVISVKLGQNLVASRIAAAA